MASITSAQAALFSRPDPITGLYQAAPTIDHFLEQLPWRRVSGYQVKVVVVTAANMGNFAERVPATAT